MTFLVNPRRSPRVPARCRVSVAYRDGGWETETEDLGPGGCQILAPQLVTSGARVRLSIASAAVGEPLSLDGVVAWTSAAAPFRLGIAFAPRGGADPVRWFDRLVRADASMAAALRRLPERLPADAMLYLAEPPRFVRDFTAEEISVLRQVGNGIRAGSLRATRPRDGYGTANAVFALLTRRLVTMSPEAAVPAFRWREILAEAEMELAADALGAGGDVLPPPEVDAAPPRQPSTRLQQLLDAAAASLGAGDIAGAAARLREAQAAAPGDERIARLLARIHAAYAAKR